MQNSAKGRHSRYIHFFDEIKQSIFLSKMLIPNISLNARVPYGYSIFSKHILEIERLYVFLLLIL